MDLYLLNKITGKSFRLPTEAEWEYAARGGNISKGYKYAGSNTISDVAWYSENGLLSGACVVGTKTPNELGLYDMSGNVSELCSNIYSPYTSAAKVNPKALSEENMQITTKISTVRPITGGTQITDRLYSARGGNWNCTAESCRVTCRSFIGSSQYSNVVGFRLAHSIEPVLVNSITFETASVSVELGNTLKPTINILPVDADNKELVWSSSDENIAIVDADGIITAVALGTATVTATTTDGSGLSASCEVVVEPEIIQVSSISMNINESRINIGETFQLEATVTPVDASNKLVSWSSSNEDVATVDDNGEVVAISAGAVIITATALDGSGVSASCKVTVLEDVDNYFIASDVTVRAGRSFAVPVEMENLDQITGFQCNIYLPEGIEFAMVDEEYDVTLSSRATSSHTVSAVLQADGSVLVLVYSVSSKVFKGNSGELFRLNLVATEDFEGDAKIEINKIKVATSAAVEYSLPDMMINVDLQRYIMGDANGSGDVSVVDIVLVANYILGISSDEFIFEAADVSGDGDISIGDIVAISNLILNNSVSTLSLLKSSEPLTDNSVVKLENLTINSGESKVIAVDLANVQNYTAFQIDLQLPQGLSLRSASLGDKADIGHTLMLNNMPDGSIRLISYSINNSNFKNNGENFLLLEVAADNGFNGGDVCAKNILFADREAKEYHFGEIKVATLSGIADIYALTQMYVEDNTIVIISPVEQIVSVSSVDGCTREYNVVVGKNLIHMDVKGLYIVRANSKTEKLFIK